MTTPLRSRTVPLDPEVDPLGLAGATGFVWSAPSGTLAGLGAAARVPLDTGAGRIERAAEAVAALLGAAEVDDPDGSGLGPVAVGALPFHAGSPGELLVPALVVRRGPDGLAWATTTGHGPAPPQAADLLARLRPGGVRGTPGGSSGPTGGVQETPPWPAGRRLDGRSAALHAWRAAVASALDEIAAGRLDKVVLARELEVETDRPFHRAAVLRRLRDRAAGAYLYASGPFLGASPELLVARYGGLATSQPMAGTVASGGTADAEARRLAWLRTSDKTAAEHHVVVDAVAETLTKVADQVDVNPAEVVRLPTVAHLATRVTARLTEPLPSAFELAGLLHPTPAVAGVPRDLALAVLDELEPFARGAYAGPVGWVDAAGDGEWAVAIRCATLTGAGARLVAGAGIVAGSDPEAEWAETEWKLAAVLGALTDG